MFEFTKRSRKILEILSQDEGRRLNSDILGPEHIFLALLNDEDSVAARILKNLGVDFEKLKISLEKETHSGDTTIILGKIPINLSYKKIIDLSKEEAKRQGNSFIGTEHILLAIFKEGSCRGLKELNNIGLDYNVIQNEILRVLGIKITMEKTSKPKNQPKKSPLEEYAINLTKMALNEELDPVIGREKEIERVIRILSRKRKNNPILIGEAGVGKTAIIEGLAIRIQGSNVPEHLKNFKVYSLDMAAIVAGTKYRGDFEERLKKVIKEIKEKKSVVVFIDEIHTIIGAGAAEGAIDAANILKPALARGDIQCVGATTISEYKKYIEKDVALVRRFQAIHVKEPSSDETFNILLGLKKRYEKHHKVVYTDLALKKAVELSERYLRERFLPDKAIDLIDEAGAMSRYKNLSKPENITNLEEEIQQLNDKKNSFVLNQEYEQAAAVRDQVNALKTELEIKQKNWLERKDEYTITVNDDIMKMVISEITGIKIEDINEEENERLLRMEDELNKIIIGQEQAINVVSNAIRRSRLGLSTKDKPIGSFVFLGPTGVGKTELAKVLAKFLFNDKKNLIRLDMSEYMEKHSVARLIGSPPGYVGYNEGGQLSEKVRLNPSSVVLFDEIEKAHPDLYNILLQILDEGELTDGSGNTISFRDTIVIMTSNVGVGKFYKSGIVGFESHDNLSEIENEIVSKELKQIFNPELLNRIDEIVYFNKLREKEISKIISLLLDEVKEKLFENNHEIVFTKSITHFLIEKGFDEKYGARNIRRIIQKEIETPLSIEFLKGNFKDVSVIRTSVKNKKINFSTTKNNSKNGKVTIKN